MWEEPCIDAVKCFFSNEPGRTLCLKSTVDSLHFRNGKSVQKSTLILAKVLNTYNRYKKQTQLLCTIILNFQACNDEAFQNPP